MSEAIRAIPTVFNGYQYKSRLEARFAEWLTDKGLSFENEPPFPGSSQGYVCDFYIPVFDLYVEVKPEALLREMEIFREDLRISLIPWICVDSQDRGDWNLIMWNLIIPQNLKFPVQFHSCRFDLIDGVLRVFPECFEIETKRRILEASNPSEGKPPYHKKHREVYREEG